MGLTDIQIRTAKAGERSINSSDDGDSFWLRQQAQDYDALPIGMIRTSQRIWPLELTPLSELLTLSSEDDRVMHCGSPQMLADMRSRKPL